MTRDPCADPCCPFRPPLPCLVASLPRFGRAPPTRRDLGTWTPHPRSRSASCFRPSFVPAAIPIASYYHATCRFPLLPGMTPNVIQRAKEWLTKMEGEALVSPVGFHFADAPTIINISCNLKSDQCHAIPMAPHAQMLYSCPQAILFSNIVN